MTQTVSFERPVATDTINTNFPITAAIAEGGDGKSFVTDFVCAVTLPNNSTVNKTMVRAIQSYVKISATEIRFVDPPTYYVFPGNAANYSAGGTTPALSAGTKVNGQDIKIDMDAFYTAAGKPRIDPEPD